MLSTAVTLSCLLSAAMAGALPNKRQESSSVVGVSCVTEMGSTSIATVPSTTTTITSTNQVVFETTTIPITTETPDAVTVTSTDYTTETETVTETTITDTFSTTSTDFVTTTTTSTVTATETTTTDVSTTTTVTISSKPSGTWYDIHDTADGYPSTGSKVKRSKCKHDPEAQSSSTLPSASAGMSLIYNTTQPTATYSISNSSTTVATFGAEKTISCGSDDTPEDNGFYAAAVYCSTTVEVLTTSTVISTGAAMTITATADTTSTTITSTITSTSTVVPDDVSTTLSFFETATITETAMVTTTATTTTTNTNVATSTTSAFSICTDSANFVMSPFTNNAGRTVELWQFTSTASYTLAVGDTSSQYACCNSCAALGTACALSYFNGNGYCYMLKPVAAYTKQSNFHLIGYTRSTLTGTKLGVANGEGGYLLQNYSG
ncbi:hypothetical protein PFICI_08235 [Pestalotiopsis fici W106-1]|uniref:Apple domain-containing protein n=1 Tax=Pestalotiopsis fici (strain W106-1 / CGMCC3.15140) TaxID=1229662 RepID=W3X6B0_PESFW|nr:uncharacterized protein PFICI_08235 [Pestalotiopsis fici W106-1]ETS80706.1 hypothetical protein PFICI_08235 [Pestalotiopsis fici W106-1]